MARLVDPRGLRYGVNYDWRVVAKSIKDLDNNVYKDLYFLKYIENIINSKSFLKKGILYDTAKIYHKSDKVCIDIYLYDSQYEEIFSKFGKKVESYYKYKLLRLERLFLLSVLKYYGVEGELTYYILDNKTLSGEALARYIGIKLSQGFQLGEAVSDIIKNLNQLIKEKNAIIYGYRISCSGRFTRRQRASYRNYKEGRLSLNMVSSFIDYGSKEIFLKYGACNIKVWLNKSYSTKHYKKRIKI